MPLSFLADPWFVIPWYAAGFLGAVWVVYDSRTYNRQLMPALKLAWPIIIFFFSILGLALYFLASRPPQPSQYREYVSPTWKKVVGADIHCVAGDGLGIMTAMAISRLLNLSFWAEFWFEYAVGFAFGWFIFQYYAMRKMGNSPLMSLWKGGRAEFFSMVTVMASMGLVMRYVTPAAVGHPPDPDTAAFWGFGALGLLAGFLATYPMNWWLVKIGWKHGQG